MIFRRERIADSSRFGGASISCRTPSIRKRMRKIFSYDSKWMSEAPFWIASTSTMLTSFTTGASSADSFSSKTSTLAPSSPSSTTSTLDEVRLHVRQDAGDGLGLRLVVPVDRLLDRGLRGDQRQDLQVRHERDVVQGEHVGRIGHREGERVAHPPDRDHLVLPRDGRRHELQDVRIDVELAERDRGDAVLSRQESDELIVVDEVQPDENRAELLGRALLLRERLLELLGGEEAVRDEEVPETAVDRLPKLHLLLLSHCNLLHVPHRVVSTYR